MGSQLFRTESVDQLIAGTQESGYRLKKVLGPWSLTAMGVGAVIGTGLWALTGTAALGVSVEAPSIWRAPVLDLILHGAEASGIYGRPGAGSAIALSYFLVAIACGFAALCYAELASMIPVAGSAYTYSYATMGELVAWIIGWDLVLEYAVSNMAVAVGFSGYLNALLENLGREETSRQLIQIKDSGGSLCDETTRVMPGRRPASQAPVFTASTCWFRFSVREGDKVQGVCDGSWSRPDV